MIKVAPSILAADFLNLDREITRMAQAGADYLHFDVMDGHFVPNMSFGPAIAQAAARNGQLPLDVHLMIDNPEQYVEPFAKSGARIITVHVEATRHLNRLIAQIHECGCLAGVALNPATPPDCLRYVLDDVDLVLVMTVNPGFGGQKMIPSAVSKIGEVNKLLKSIGSQAEIEVDGGVNEATAPAMARQGASLLVTGSALFGAEDAAGMIARFKAMSA